jgi:hypothetical protein
MSIIGFLELFLGFFRVLKIVLGIYVEKVVHILGRFLMMRMRMKDCQLPVLEVRMTSQTLAMLSNA